MNKCNLSTVGTLLLLLNQGIDSFTVKKSTPIVRSKNKCTIVGFPLHAIEVPTLDDLDDNHEKEASRLAQSIIGWLDREWMPQEVHVQMASCVEQTYIKARQEGETEIMNVMTNVVDDLESNWKEYDKNSFVNAWDIGNYVSDYLHLRIDPSGSCGCSANIFNPDE